MNKLRECLVRMGVEHLAGLLGPNSIRLLELLNERSITASALAELVLSQFGPEYLLYERAARSEILLGLKADDASRLARLLSFESPAEPFAALSSVDFRKGTHPSACCSHSSASRRQKGRLRSFPLRERFSGLTIPCSTISGVPDGRSTAT